MNGKQNPFASRPTGADRSGSRRYLWAGAVILVLLAGAAAGVAFYQQAETLKQVRSELADVREQAVLSQSQAADLQKSLAATETRAKEFKEKLAGSQSQVKDLQTRLASSQSQVQHLEKEKQAAVQAHQGLADQMRAELESKDVTISQLQGKLTVNILDRILFDSGEAVLQPAGEAVLRQIAGILTQHPALQIHVVGHTDNVPIRASTRSRFATNWELSTARALAAVRFLTEQAEVDPRRLGAVGYGEFRPIADNSTPEGRSQNRRIAITILADELAGADSGPTVKTNAPSLQAVRPSPEDSR